VVAALFALEPAAFALGAALAVSAVGAGATGAFAALVVGPGANGAFALVLVACWRAAATPRSKAKTTILILTQITLSGTDKRRVLLLRTTTL